MSHVAVGFRAHSGWAAVVSLAGPPASPTVVDRRRIELADAAIEGSKQPYHEAEGKKPKEAERDPRGLFQSEWYRHYVDMFGPSRASGVQERRARRYA